MNNQTEKPVVWTAGHIERLAVILQEALEIEVDNVVSPYRTVAELKDSEIEAYVKGVQEVITTLTACFFERVASSVEDLSDEENLSLQRRHYLDHYQVIGALEGAVGERMFRRHPELAPFPGRLRWLNQTMTQVRELRAWLGESRNQHLQLHAAYKLRGWGGDQWYRTTCRELDRRLGNAHGKHCQREERPFYQRAQRELDAAHHVALQVEREISQEWHQAALDRIHANYQASLAERRAA